MKKNKGFSLVELIIVIAIMAILVGVMAPQLIKYIERAKESSDVQVLDSIRTAVTVAASDPKFATSTQELPSGAVAYNAISSTILSSLAYETVPTGTVKFKSKKAGTGSTAANVNIEYNSNTQVKVTMTGGSISIDFDGSTYIAD